MNRIGLAGIISGVVLCAAILLLRSPMVSQFPRTLPARTPLVVLCAASNRQVLESVAAEYEKTTGVKIQLVLGASQSLLSGTAISHVGDLYVPADDSYIAIAREQQLLAGESIPLGRMKIVLAVSARRTEAIPSLKSLTTSGARVAIGDPEVAAIGRIVREHLTRRGEWTGLESSLILQPTVIEALHALQIGATDAAIVYELLLRKNPELRALELPEFNDLYCDVAVGILKHSSQSDESLRFARYLGAAEQGGKIYREHGFLPPASLP
ncbi:MAG: molybdate ABC transporter substrate-binding protein [Planctomycetota bacterium]|nr:MAG: molybdate ABC transporter substrate-binding protein [Planctomycetota bacterium]